MYLRVNVPVSHTKKFQQNKNTIQFNPTRPIFRNKKSKSNKAFADWIYFLTLPRYQFMSSELFTIFIYHCFVEKIEWDFIDCLQPSRNLYF